MGPTERAAAARYSSHLERAPGQRTSRAPDRHSGVARDHERGPHRSPVRIRAVGRRPPDPQRAPAFLLSGKQMRVIASVYTGSTEKRAIDDLVGLGAQVRISYDTTQTRLHANLGCLSEPPSFDTAYVGSSNLTQSALVDGLEWNVRLTSTDNPDIVEQIRRTFDQYWNDPEFELYDPRVDSDRLEEALASQASASDDLARHLTDCRSTDAEALSGPDARESSSRAPAWTFQEPRRGANRHRKDVGFRLRLPVAPRAGYERLLFVAHRDEILRQSQDVFRLVLGELGFGERHAGSERPVAWAHVFASIQSLHRVVDSLQPDQFDVVIVDEFHHAEADTYRKLLDRLSPKVLLGLTATPERADGNDILHWFDDRIAYEMRLWEALDRGLLSPFHYLGISDGTDLRRVRFERGRYVTSELEEVLPETTFGPSASSRL